MQPGFSAIRPSRNGITSPLGKKTARLEPPRIEPVMKERFRALAASCGKSEAEAIRDLAYVVVLGPIEAARVYGEGVVKVFNVVVGKTVDKAISE